MLARKFRLPLKEFNRGRALIVKSDYFSVQLAPNRLSHNRLAVIISAKTESRSTRRHFLKRRLVGALQTLPNFSRDFLLILSPQIKNLPPADFEREIKKVIIPILK